MSPCRLVVSIFVIRGSVRSSFVSSAVGRSVYADAKEWRWNRPHRLVFDVQSPGGISGMTRIPTTTRRNCSRRAFTLEQNAASTHTQQKPCIHDVSVYRISRNHDQQINGPPTAPILSISGNDKIQTSRGKYGTFCHLFLKSLDLDLEINRKTVASMFSRARPRQIF